MRLDWTFKMRIGKLMRITCVFNANSTRTNTQSVVYHLGFVDCFYITYPCQYDKMPKLRCSLPYWNKNFYRSDIHIYWLGFSFKTYQPHPTPPSHQFCKLFPHFICFCFIYRRQYDHNGRTACYIIMDVHIS